MFRKLSKTEQISRLKRQVEILSDYQKAVDTASSIAFVTLAEKGNIDEVTAMENIDLFSPWVSGCAYAVGALRQYEDGLYKCVQAHTSQDDWTPDVATSLWSKAGDPSEEYPAWSQPVGGHDAYSTGNKVTYDEKKWVSTVDGNVWIPGVYGWEEVDE